MKLLIVSHTAHYKGNEGYSGWAPTVKEIDFLAGLFDTVTHIAPVHAFAPDTSAASYQAANIRIRSVSPAGGESLSDKIKVISKIPEYIRALMEEVPKADVIHVRSPANISLIAVILLFFLKKKSQRCWVKYAGDWKPLQADTLSCRFQRWMLRRNWHRGLVTINGKWSGQSSHIRSLLNPCITNAELLRAVERARHKTMSFPVKILFAGHMIEGKGADKMVKIAAALRDKKVPFKMDLAGDGPIMGTLKQRIKDLRLTGEVILRGWESRSSMVELYERVHLLCLPSRTEGWPKVIGEAMARGVIPLATPVGSIPHYLTRFQLGKMNEPDDIEGFCQDIQHYAAKPEIWKEESTRALKSAGLFTYEKYLEEIRGFLKL